MDIKQLLSENQIFPDPLKDQFFLVDEKVIEQIVDFAVLNDQDVVLEIGAGVGNLTREIAKKAGEVISYEIDEKFKPILEDLPENVKINFKSVVGDLSLDGKFLKKKEFNKIVANIPYSISEWLLHNLTYLQLDKVVLLVPKKFVYSAQTNPVFASFYKVVPLIELPKDEFYPVPKTDSVVIDLQKLEDPIETKNLGLFLRQFMYQNEEWKVKNSLREGLSKFVWLVYQKRLTKNQAKEIIEKSSIDSVLLESTPGLHIYDAVSEKLKTELLSGVKIG